MAQNMGSAMGLQVSCALLHRPVFITSVSSGGLRDFPDTDVETAFLEAEDITQLGFLLILTLCTCL